MDHFILNRWVLRAAGLWAPETSSKCVHRLFRCYTVFCVVYVHLYFTATEAISLKETHKDLKTLVKNLSLFLTHALGAIKIGFWHYQSKKIKSLITILESKEFSYESLGEFQPVEVFKQAKRAGIKYTLIFLMMAHMTVATSYGPPLATTLIKLARVDSASDNATFYQPLPYYSWMPFRYDTPITYICALFYQMPAMYCYVYSIVGMDTLFMNFMNLIGAHMTIIKGAFKSVVSRCKDTDSKSRVARSSKDTTRFERILTNEFKRSVRHMQTVFSCCNELESIYQYMNLAQLLFTVFIFCMCLFLVSTTPVTSKSFASEVVYMVAMGFQLLLYCWFGNEVTLKASEISNALYESDWLETSYTYKSNMLITMIRTRRPLFLTAGKFTPLTLDTFMGVLRSSYSVFAVLRSVNE